MTVQQSRFKYFLSALSAAIIWGFFAIPLRELQAYPAEQILYCRILFSLGLTLVLLLVFRRQSIQGDLSNIKALPSSEKKKFLLYTLLAGVCITVNWYSFIYVINNVSLKSSAFAYMVCPLITALGGFTLLKESATIYKVAGILLAVCSILILARGSFHDVIWSIFIATFYAAYLLIQRVTFQIDKLLLLGLQLMIATMIITPIFLFNHFTIPFDIPFWINISIIALFFTIIPLVLSLYALMGLDSSTMGIIIYINPIVSFTVAFMYFNETVSGIQAVAYLLLFIAVVIFNWQFIKELNKGAKRTL
ncbi:MAG TPA: EamA family transporter [Pedobacter sp.]